MPRRLNYGIEPRAVLALDSSAIMEFLPSQFHPVTITYFNTIIQKLQTQLTSSQLLVRSRQQRLEDEHAGRLKRRAARRRPTEGWNFRSFTFMSDWRHRVLTSWRLHKAFVSKSLIYLPDYFSLLGRDWSHSHVPFLGKLSHPSQMTRKIPGRYAKVHFYGRGGFCD